MRALEKARPVARGEELGRITDIRPSAGWVALQLRETWEYRELLYLLTWREVKVRYKQTLLGGAWAVIQPLFTMIVFSLFFGKLAKIPSEGIPYPVWSYAGLLPWQYFSQAVISTSDSVVSNANLIKRVYFPRLIVPLSASLFGLVDFAVAFVLLIGMMIYYQLMPTAALVLLPAFLLLALVTALGVGLWLSALNAKYRDFRYVLPFLTQLWLFATPVAYPSALLPEPWRTLYGLNPMAGVVEGFRWALLGTQPPSSMILVSILAAAALLVGGAFYFRRMERTFADAL